MDAMVYFLSEGFLHAPWWGIVLYTLLMTHITITSVTIFLHRAQAHRALELHPAVSHFFRLWLWLTTGMITQEWVAVHRKHHAKCDTESDPHSPQTWGIWKVLLEGSELYRESGKSMRQRVSYRPGVIITELRYYSKGTPDDWLERHVYSQLLWQGVGLMLLVDVFLFGVIGITVWAVQMLWIPVTAAGIINGLGHYMGYRNFQTPTPDASANISPWGILIGGEELHNNHHAYPTSARLSARWYEFDVGWLYIRLLELCHLATVKHQMPRLLVDKQAEPFTFEALQALQKARFHVLARFDQLAGKPRNRKEEMTALRSQLEALWQLQETREELLIRFRAWCREVEKIRVPQLSQFAWRLARFRLKS